MDRRVIVGSSSLAQSLAKDLDGASGSVVVVTNDANRAKALSEVGVDVREADPTEVSTLAGVERCAVVAAFHANGAVNRRILEIARSTHPEAHRIAYTGDQAAGDRERLGALADQVIDTCEETTTVLLDRVGSDGGRVHQLYRVVRGIDQLAVVAHENPDPDAIASAVALARIAATVGSEATVCYHGDISHQENRAMVNLLEYELRNLEADETLAEFDGVALIDHARPGVNDQLSRDRTVDIVIDHHPPRAPVEAEFVDLRSEVGATSTLLVDYLESTGPGLPADVATGLLYGIRVDTDEFSRQVSVADFEAAATLLPHADLGLLERVEAPSISGETLDTVADAIHNRRQEGTVLLSCVGGLNARDALSQAADRLLELEDVSTTVIYGFIDGTVYVSARSRGTTVDLGETLREAFDQIGSAGGHAHMAGAQLSLGLLASVEDREDSLVAVVESLVADRFLEALESRASRAVSVHDDRDEDAYIGPEEPET